MNTIELYESKMGAIICDDLIDMSVFGDKSSRYIEIPMSYCSITRVDTGPDVDDPVVLTLDMKRPIGYGNQHAVLPQRIVLPLCIHRTEDSIFKCHFLNGGVQKGMKNILSVVEEINCEYLELYEDDVIAIQNISRTMRSLKTARKIIEDKLSLKG